MEVPPRDPHCHSCGSKLPARRPVRASRIRCGTCREWTFGHLAEGEPRRVRLGLARLLKWLLSLLIPSFLRRPNPRPWARGRPVAEIPLDRIRMSEILPRRSLDVARQEILERSVARFGVLSPIVVRRVRKGFELVTGHRRCLAARKAGLRTVPAIIRKICRREAEILRYLENTAADPPGPLEEAEAFERIFLKGPPVDRDRLARRLGIDPEWVAGRLELLTLPPVVQDALLARLIDPVEARAVARVGKSGKMARWIEKLSRGEAAIADLMEYLDREPPVRGETADAGDPLELLDEALDGRHR
jgi:ParB/RepB/Spo0J family partition protein